MASRTQQRRELRERRLEQEAQARQAQRARALRNRVLLVIGGAVVVLAIVFAVSQSGGGGGSAGAGGGSGGGKYPYAVGSPGPGRQAPAIDLPSTRGGRFDLASMRGKTVLLYFQEGLTCQPCWDQLKDLEHQGAQLRALGIDRMVSITSDSLGDLKQKASDEGLSSPVLADSDLAVSKAYSANQYGMMGDSRDGHSFIVVGPDGRIRWRADYGGAPKYTMYVPVKPLLADMRRGLRRGA